ncbi:hypothetical protein Tco_1545428, partial [Tanacetum coccineum]
YRASGDYHQQDEGKTVEVVWACQERRRPQSTPVRRVEALVVDGMRRRGRPELRWEDRVKLDMKELLLSEDMTSDGNDLCCSHSGSAVPFSLPFLLSLLCF